MAAHAILVLLLILLTFYFGLQNVYTLLFAFVLYCSPLEELLPGFR